MRFRWCEKPAAMQAVHGLIMYRMTRATACVGGVRSEELIAVTGTAMRRRVRAERWRPGQSNEAGGALGPRELLIFTRDADDDWQRLVAGAKRRMGQRRATSARRRPASTCVLRRCPAGPADRDGWERAVADMVARGTPRFGVVVHDGAGRHGEIVKDIECLVPMFSDRTCLILWGMARLGTRRAFAALVRRGWLGAWLQDFAVMTRPPLTLPRVAEEKEDASVSDSGGGQPALAAASEHPG